MYAQNRTPDPMIQEHGGAQSFRRGSYNIPASYAGNAFLSDEDPTQDAAPHMPSPMPEELPDALSAKSAEPSAPEQSLSGEKQEPSRIAGLFDGMLSKLDRLETDDLILIGLILLLSRERKNSTETLILLVLLLLT